MYFLTPSTKMTTSIDSSVGMSIDSNQILPSKYKLSLKGHRSLWRSWPQAVAGNIQAEFEDFYDSWNEYVLKPNMNKVICLSLSNE